MKNWLQNKTVIITGASGGIGFEIAKLLIENYNCKIIGIARNEQKIKAAINTLKKRKSNFTFCLFDVSKRENWNKFKETLSKNEIIPDVLINNAGFMLPFEKFENINEEEIDEIVNTNFMATVNATNLLLPILEKSPTPAIINISSAAGYSAVVGQAMYCATKYAVRGFTETLIQEYKNQIYIAGVYPGFIKTNILNRMSVTDKENKLIQKLMMPKEKAAKKIVKGLCKKRNYIKMGVDGKLMGFFGRIFPKITNNTITSVLKDSNLQLFEDVFETKELK